MTNIEDFNTIVFHDNLTSEGKVDWSSNNYFRQRVFNLIKQGFVEITLDFSGVLSPFPNGMVPIISEVSRLRGEGISFTVLPPLDDRIFRLFERNNWLHYLDPVRYALSNAPLGLKKFSSDEELNNIVSLAVETCLRELNFGEGAPMAFEWALNEIAGNVLVHSGSETGWLEVSVYPNSHRLSLVVCDSGVGIPKTMAAVKHEYPFGNDTEALSVAMKPQVTSNPEFGQGNGLAGALSIAQHSEGMLAITSGHGRIVTLNGDVIPKNSRYPFVGTFVEMQFSSDTPIDLPSALWGHQPVSHIEMAYEKSDGSAEFRLTDYASSFGNRLTGQKLNRLVQNLLKNSYGKRVIIKMDDVSIISSSFADELFGKLFVLLGPIDFGKYVQLDGINPTCRSIVDRAINQRMMQEMKSKLDKPE